MKHVRLPAVWLVMVGGAATAPLFAQNNSLFPGAARAGAPAPASTTQPAAPAETVFSNQTLAARAALAVERPDQQQNSVLLHASPYAVRKPEPQKIKVQDLVTIIVRESKTANSDGKMESNKEWKFDTGLDEWIRFSNVNGIVPAQFPEGNPGIVFDFKDEYSTDGTYDRKDELTTRITARVIDVKPNGNLVLEAQKEIQVDDEGYRITLTGECRAADVTPDNTVLSTQIAEPQINVQHTGTVRDATRRGWLKRMLDFLRIW